jgi:hypothetical protein
MEVPSGRPLPKTDILPLHYHGHIVRRLFLIAGITMAGTLPFFTKFISIPLFLSILAIVIIAFLAGLESPEHRYVVVLNTLVASIACAMFEYQAAHFYLTATTSMPLDSLFFWINQGLAVIFFFALYYSSKTVRGAMKNGDFKMK